MARKNIISLFSLINWLCLIAGINLIEAIILQNQFNKPDQPQIDHN
jgi:hypothetical protein